MSATYLNTRLRARSRFAFWKAIQRGLRHIIPSKAPHLSDHIARDIGPSESDLEKIRFEWPSDGPNRPMI